MEQRLSRDPEVQSFKVGQRGLTLIELMISLVLGLILIGGVLNIFVSNQRTYQTTENLNLIQQNARSGFDFMARDLREVGENPCGTIQVGNVIRNVSNAIPWWANWNLGTVIGVDGGQDRTDIVAFGTGSGQRVSGTDAVLVIRAAQDEKIIALHDTATKEITLNAGDGLNADDVLVACDLESAAIFQIASKSGIRINYDPASATLNCNASLGYPTPATCTSPPGKTFSAGGMVSKLTSSFWYVGYTANGKRSLYRTRIIKKSTGITTEPEEVITGVQDLQMTYLTKAAGVLASNWVAASDSGSFPGASSTTTGNWRTDDSATQPNVAVATRIDMTLQSDDNIGTDQQPIQRHLIHVVSLRNRETPSVSAP